MHSMYDSPAVKAVLRTDLLEVITDPANEREIHGVDGRSTGIHSLSGFVSGFNRPVSEWRELSNYGQGSLRYHVKGTADRWMAVKGTVPTFSTNSTNSTWRSKCLFIVLQNDNFVGNLVIPTKQTNKMLSVSNLLLKYSRQLSLISFIATK